MSQDHSRPNMFWPQISVKEQNEAPQFHGRTDVAVDVPEWFRRYCSAIGMSSQAPDAWAIIHINPHIACIFCLLSVFLGIVCGIIYIVASQRYRWHYHSVPGAWVIFYTFVGMFLCRYGPLPAGYKQLAYIGCCIVTLSTSNLSTIILIFGPEEACLFRDRMALVMFDATSLFLIIVGAFFGGWPPDYPKRPHKYDHL